jgi:hypothetical protein
MCAKLGLARCWIGATGTPAASELCLVSEPEADCASECSFLYTIATTSIIRQRVDLGDQDADSKVQMTVRLKVSPAP